MNFYLSILFLEIIIGILIIVWEVNLMKQTKFLFVCALLTFSMIFVACGGDDTETTSTATESSSEKEQVKIPGSADEDSKKDPVPAATKKDDDHDHDEDEDHDHEDEPKAVAVSEKEDCPDTVSYTHLTLPTKRIV